MALFHWNTNLCEGDGGFNPERPESQRPGPVWSSGTAGLNDRITHHVSACQCLWTVQVRRHMQHCLSSVTAEVRDTLGRLK